MYGYRVYNTLAAQYVSKSLRGYCGWRESTEEFFFLSIFFTQTISEYTIVCQPYRHFPNKKHTENNFIGRILS